jgi:hypothetical protein
MLSFRSLFLFVSVCAGACGNPLTGTALHGGTKAEAGVGSDASLDAGIDSSDGTVTCSGPLGDAGFSSFADLPVAELCSQSAAGGYGAGIVEESPACQGSTFVWSPTETDCGLFWVFDATTGALQAVGGGCNGGLGCSGAATGFDFPNQCLSDWATSLQGGKELCPDAGGDGGPEASTD